MAEKKKSLKPIPPTLRGKKRYIKFELVCDSLLHEGDVKKGLFAVFSELFGSKGIAEQKLWLVKSMGGNKFIVRCSLAKEPEVRAGLLFLSKIAGKPVIPIIMAVSGSIAKLTH